jgi:uncharacterized membrane protein YphA (DoxX/SURF4 family)
VGTDLSIATDSRPSRPGVRHYVAIVACILLGGTFLFAGAGKLADIGQMPGQVEYIDKMIPDFLLTPQLAQFIGFVAIPYILPIMETILGLLLLAGVFIKVDSIVSLLLSAAFAFNNFWMVSRGIDKYPDCTCFGIWETMMGAVSPAISLRLDIIMSGLALLIIFIQPGGILASQFWWERSIKRPSTSIH